MFYQSADDYGECLSDGHALIVEHAIDVARVFDEIVEVTIELKFFIVSKFLSSHGGIFMAAMRPV